MLRHSVYLGFHWLNTNGCEISYSPNEILWTDCIVNRTHDEICFHLCVRIGDSPDKYVKDAELIDLDLKDELEKDLEQQRFGNFVYEQVQI